METIALVLFAVAALGGLFLAVRHFKGATLPIPVAVLHGLLAATGLVLLIVAYLQAGEAAGTLGLALLLLVLAALGGFFLISFHLRGKRLPSAGVVAHAILAVAGVITLVLVIL